MAEQTTNYNLTKPAPEDFYNVQDQNGNMDAIDTALKGLADNKANNEDLTSLQQEVTTHLDDYTQFKDYTETELEDLKLSVSDGKQLVGMAITDVDPKVTVPTQPTFQDLATAISSIKTGMKFATGTISDIYATYAGVSGTINTLDFKPNIVIFIFTSGYYASTSIINCIQASSIDGSLGGIYKKSQTTVNVADISVPTAADFFEGGFGYLAKTPAMNQAVQVTNITYIALKKE